MPAIGALRKATGVAAREAARRREVLAKARARAGGRRHALLHGRRLARGEGRPGVRPRAGDGARRAGARHGGLRHARHADAGASRPPRAKPASPPTTTTSTPRRSSTARSSPRATYDDRLDTLERVRHAGITVCCGGIIGMGESVDDRAAMLQTLANLDPQPESVPINALVAVRARRSRTSRRSTRSSWCA